jgi:hypothetical protein
MHSEEWDGWMDGWMDGWTDGQMGGLCDFKMWSIEMPAYIEN